MDIVPFVREGLGNSSYLVGIGEDSAVMIDPDRIATRYLQAAEQRGWHIVATFETHLHADFVTGGREIAHATDAVTYISSEAGARFPHQAVTGGDAININGVGIHVIASPGHSPESLSYVLRTPGGPPALFSGGVLTAGSAARTDLLTPTDTEPLTRALFKTLRSAFNDLPDETLLLPTHGGGSFCTAGTGGERTSTLGHERQTNPVLMGDDVGEFLKWFPKTFPRVPAYFAYMRAINQAGPRLRKDLRMPAAMPPEQFRAESKRAAVIDARPVDDFARAHVPGSISIVARDQFATWLGWLVPLGTPLVFVLADDAQLDAVIDECLLIGHEGLAGWLKGGIAAWERAGFETKATAVIDSAELRRLAADGATVLDVREPDEWAAGRIAGAQHIPLGDLPARLGDIPRDRPLITYCGLGQRSTTAASLLERAGIGPVSNLRGGMTAWREAGQPVQV